VVRQWNQQDFRNLHQAGRFLSKENKKTLGLLMPVDVYVQDPYVAESDEGLALKEIWIGCEPELMAGPTSARIAVVDYDADANRLEDPVQWDRKNRRFFFERNGEKVAVTRSHRDLPQFHQVNVWAIIQSVLDMYEATWVLGRSAPWAFEGNRLRRALYLARRHGKSDPRNGPLRDLSRILHGELHLGGASDRRQRQKYRGREHRQHAQHHRQLVSSAGSIIAFHGSICRRSFVSSSR